MGGFSHVTQVTAQSYVLVVNASVPAKTIPELVAYSNTQPNGLTFGSSGQGSLQHLSGALLSTLGKAKLLHVPYKGGGPALADVLAGQINMIFATPLESADAVRCLIASARQIRPRALDDVVARYRTLDVPTLLIWGRGDRVVPLSVGQRLALDLPRARLVVLDRCGHLPAEELPDESYVALERFLDEGIEAFPAPTRK